VILGLDDEPCVVNAVLTPEISMCEVVRPGLSEDLKAALQDASSGSCGISTRKRSIIQTPSNRVGHTHPGSVRSYCPFGSPPRTRK